MKEEECKFKGNGFLVDIVKIHLTLFSSQLKKLMCKFNVISVTFFMALGMNAEVHKENKHTRVARQTWERESSVGDQTFQHTGKPL